MDVPSYELAKVIYMYLIYLHVLVTLAEVYGSVIRNLFGRHNQFVFVVIIRKSHDGVTVILVNKR